jgi:acyl-CoA synthetase (AMP-forming)/AMP-acid ligase II
LGERCPGERRVLAFERLGRHVLRGTRPIYGEEINAAVILRPGASATAQELTEYCQARLAAFEVPKRFCFVTSLPRTAKESDDRRQLAITSRSHPRRGHDGAVRCSSWKGVTRLAPRDEAQSPD